MLGYLFDNKKKKRDNLERYDDKRRQDNRGNRDGNGDGDDNRGSSGKGPNRQNLMIMLLATVIALVVISYVMNMGSEGATRISYNEFVQLVKFFMGFSSETSQCAICQCSHRNIGSRMYTYIRITKGVLLTDVQHCFFRIIYVDAVCTAKDRRASAVRTPRRSISIFLFQADSS